MPLMTNAGMVKVAPAATDSPMEPMVRAMFSSSRLPLDQFEQRHADDGGRVGGGDGHAGAQAQVHVGRAKNHRHDQSQEHGAQGELAHLAVGGHIRTEGL